MTKRVKVKVKVKMVAVGRREEVKVEVMEKLE